MCIIILKPKKKSIPSREMMEICFENNPDGAGFMYRTEDHKVHILKGFMTLDDLCTAIDKADAVTPLKKRDVVFHFRISTTGSTVPSNTHPFPLSNHVRDLKQLDMVCDRAIAHNGILREYATFHNKKSDMSDTMYFAKMLCGVNERFVEALLNHHSAGSRFVYMSGQKTIHVGMTRIVSGDGAGLLVSNDTYKEMRVVYNYVPMNRNWHHGCATHASSSYAVEQEEKWERWDDGTRTKKPSTFTGVDRTMLPTNPVYARWFNDKSMTCSFPQYCNDIDTNIKAAVDKMNQQNLAKEPASVGDIISQIHAELPTLQTERMFRFWFEDIADLGESCISSPVNRAESMNNPAYARWFNTVEDGDTFQEFCTRLEDELVDMAKEYGRSWESEPATTPAKVIEKDTDEKHKQEREQRYAERAAFTEYLERGC